MSPHFTDEKLSLGEIREFAQGHAPGNSGSPVSHICIFCRTVFLSLEKKLCEENENSWRVSSWE